MTTQPSEFGSPKKIPDVVLRDMTPPPPQKTTAEIAEEQRSKLPTPSGYRILILPQVIHTRTASGIYLTDKSVEQEHLATTVGYVVDTGPDAYADSDKFPHGAWCKAGDYVLFGRYAGSRVTMYAENEDHLTLRLLNDDEIIAVITNPEDYVGIAR
jgi:co-chaperonin GroES (HSP10)